MRLLQERTSSFLALKGLISIGNEKIDEAIHAKYIEVNSSLFLYGKTGAGKTTTLYHLGGKSLKSRLTDEGDWILEPVYPLSNIDVDHTASSGTKIPNNYYTSNVLIWDLPGLNDTGEKIQGIANAFYIRRLFEVSKNARFVLIVSESSITSDKGTEFLEIIERFLKTFTETDFLKSSLSLIVTKVSSNKSISQISKSIENIEDQNISLVSNPEIKKVLGFLKNSIHIISRQEKEGEFPRNVEMLQTILQRTKETEIGPYLGSFNVDERSTKYITELAKVIENCLRDVMKIITEANNRTHNCTNEDMDPFIASHEQVKQIGFNPSNYVSPKIIQKLCTKAYSNFPLIEFLQKLEQTLDINGPNLNDIKDALVNNLKIFESFSEIQSTKEIMTDYIGIVQNTIECLKFLKNSCDQPLTLEATIFNTIRGCKDFISVELQEQIVKIKLVKGSNLNYFEQALKLFNLYPENLGCKILAAECYYEIGNLYITKDKFSEAVECYKESLTLNKTNNFYNKIADTFHKIGEYKLALEAYKVKGVIVKVKRCYKKLEEKILDDEILSEHYLDKARYFSEVHHYGKAVSFFETAAGLTTVEEKRKAIITEGIETFKAFSENTGPGYIVDKWIQQRDIFGGINEVHVNRLTDMLSIIVPTISVPEVGSYLDLS